MNITFAFDDELIAAAKAVAARHGTSVTSLVRTSLEQQVAVDNRSSSGASGVMQELIDYSLGFKPRTAVMAELGLDDYGSLLRLLNAANLPHPIVPIAKRKAMVAEMTMAIQGE